MQGNGVFHRFEETGPPRSAFKFGIAVKERCACDRVDKSSWAFFIQVGCGKRRLSALLEGDFLLLGRQQLKAQSFPEIGFLAVVSRIASNLLAVLEQHDGGCREQGFLQCPASGRI